MKYNNLSVEDMVYIALAEWVSKPELRERYPVLDYVTDRVFEVVADDIFDAVKRGL